MPDVSIVIPSHNRWHLLRRTLAGALAQEGVDHEVIIVDDGSSDGTSERLADLDEPRLRVFRHEQGRGVARARNRGLEEARGDWVAFLDDDDLWAPLKLRCQLDAALERDAPFSYAGAVVIDERLEVVDVQRAPDPDRVLDDVLGWQAVPGGCSNAIVPTALARRVGGFDTELSMAADWDMWTRLLLAAEGRAAACAELFVGYLRHPGNMSVVDADVFLRELDHIEARYADERRARGVEVDGVGFSRWLAGGYRRSGNRTAAARAYLHGARRHRNAGNLVRAAGVLLGERVMNRLSPYRPERLPHEPGWLPLYREGGRLESVPVARDSTAA
jgi:glycosyltransferase involved in cell wall biosynthesis